MPDDRRFVGSRYLNSNILFCMDDYLLTFHYVFVYMLFNLDDFAFSKDPAVGVDRQRLRGFRSAKN